MTSGRGKGLFGRRRRCTRETPACDFWNWGEGSTRPDCCTSHLKEMLDFTGDLLESEGVHYWLDYGALLGAVRTGELIPWDVDADLGVLVDDVPGFEALRARFEAAGYELTLRVGSDGATVNRVRVQYSPVNEAHVEFFTWQREGDLLVTDMTDDVAWPGMRGTMNFPAGFIESPAAVQLYGRDYPAPAPVHDFLVEHRFGPDYMTPRRRVAKGLFASVEAEEMTPFAQELLDELSVKQERWFARSPAKTGSPQSRLGELTAPRLPKVPDPEYLEPLLARAPADESSPAVERLTLSIARLDQALAEVAGGPRARLRGLRRRSELAYRALLKKHPRLVERRVRRAERIRKRRRMRKRIRRRADRLLGR